MASSLVVTFGFKRALGNSVDGLGNIERGDGRSRSGMVHEKLVGCSFRFHQMAWHSYPYRYLLAICTIALQSFSFLLNILEPKGELTLLALD